MGKKTESRNILLTTISTMNNPGVNCYRTRVNDTLRICAGVAQQEPGSKYFMSQNRMDRIIAICSDEVIGDDNNSQDDAVIMDFHSDWDALKAKWDNNKDIADFSAVDFYKLRVGAFLYDPDFDDSMLRDIITALYKKESFDDVENIENNREPGAFEYYDEMTGKMVDAFLGGELDEELIEYAGSFDKNYRRSYIWYKVYQKAKENNLILKAHNIKPGSTLEFVTVRDQYTNGVANINGIIEAINRDYDDFNINIYIDVQGGTRTSQFTVYNVMQILNDEAKYQDNTNRFVVNVCATQFNPRKLWTNEIVDETKRYSIINAVSGMNAFIRFGRTKALQTYFSGGAKDSEVNNLKAVMNDFENYLLTNQTGMLQESLMTLYKLVGKQPEALGKEEHTPNNEKEEMYSLLTRQIYKSIKGIVRDDGEIDYIKLVDWCFAHYHILQAYTVAESKMPEYIIKNGIITIDEDPEYFEAFYLLSYAKAQKLDLSKDEKGKFICKSNIGKSLFHDYDDPYHYIIAVYLNTRTNNSKKHLDISLNSDKDDITLGEFIGKFEAAVRIRNEMAHSNKNSDDREHTKWKDLKEAFEKCKVEGYSENPDNKKLFAKLNELSVVSVYIYDSRRKTSSILDNKLDTIFDSFLSVVKRDMEYWNNNEKDRMYFLKNSICKVISEYNVVGMLEECINLKQYDSEIIFLLWNAVFRDGYSEKKDKKIFDSVRLKEYLEAGKADKRDEIPEAVSDDSTKSVGAADMTEDYDGEEVAVAETEDNEPAWSEGETDSAEMPWADDKTEDAEEAWSEAKAKSAEADHDDMEEGYEYLKDEIARLNTRVKELEWQIKNLEQLADSKKDESKGFFARFFGSNK